MKLDIAVKMVPFWSLQFSTNFQIIVDPDDINIPRLKDILKSNSEVISFCKNCIKINTNSGYFEIRGLQLNENSYITGLSSEMSYIIKTDISKENILMCLEYYIHLIENL